ncbi:hypothetical protein SAY86_001470 [Trapa natans]|uniref:Ubiquitin receptor RAD23 n=1 Tax=Trapa natans TaxID=22666 RepID=A0AAN7RGI3_TRANT|nr:hypothetical protein SAY86_001470 [Trapa natans]
MKLTVKTLKGSHFKINVLPTDTIMAVKKNIEDVQGKDNYPCGQQLLIHTGKILQDETTLADNKISEDGFLVVMLSKSKSSGSGCTSISSTQPTFTNSAAPPLTTNPPATIEAPIQALPAMTISTSVPDGVTANPSTDAYSQAALHLVTGNSLDNTIQQIMDIGGGVWDRETVARALRATYNNPDRAIDYLYSGIPEMDEIAAPMAHLPTSQVNEVASVAAVTAPTSEAPNTSPLNLFPQGTNFGAAAGGPGSLDFLRNNQQFQTLRTMVQTNPQILQPMLQELGKQNPQLLRMIQEHQSEFLQLINEPLEGSQGDMFDQVDQDMSHVINVTPAEQEAIERLEAMGFERMLVIEAFLACDRDEELAANYLLEHAADFDD